MWQMPDDTKKQFRRPSIWSIRRKSSEQNTNPGSHDPKKKLKVSANYFTEVKRTTPKVALTIVKLLFGKVCYENKHLDEEEQLVLFHCFETARSHLDKSWLLSNTLKLDKLQFLLESYTRMLKLGSDAAALQLIAKGFKFKEAVFSSHAYFGLAKLYDCKRLLRRVTDDNYKTSSPPKRFIGVGYSDKGTCPIPHEDGSQSWQTVATSRLIRDLPKKESHWTASELVILTAWGRFPLRINLVNNY